MQDTIGIKEALIEYLETYVVNKKLTLRQIESIEKLFVKSEDKSNIDGPEDFNKFNERSVSEDKVAVDNEDEVWNELGAEMYGGYSFAWFKDELGKIKKRFSLKRKK